MSEMLSDVLDLRARSDYAQARELARAAADEDAEPALLLELGRLEEETSNHDASAAAFERALASSQNELRARAAAGLVLARRGQGRVSEAHELAIAELARAPESPELLIEAGELAAEFDDFARAQTHLQRAVVSAADDDQRTRALAALGNFRALHGRYEEAERLLREALDLAESAGPMSIEASLVLNNLGTVLRLSGKVREAQELFERSLEIIERALGAEAEPAATLHHNLGRVLRAQGDFAAALSHARASVEIHVKTLGPDHLDTALDKAALASILDGLGDVAEAEALLREAIPVLRRELSAGHREVAVHLNNLAALVARRGEASDAETLYRESLSIKESGFGPDSPALAATLNNLAVLLKRTGRIDEARELYERAIRTLEEVEPDHPILQSARGNLAGLGAKG